MVTVDIVAVKSRTLVASLSSTEIKSLFGGAKKWYESEVWKLQASGVFTTVAVRAE